MKTVDNYKNFDIKMSKLGNYFAYSDVNLSDYMRVKLGKYNNIEDAKNSFERHEKEWKIYLGVE